MTKIYVGHNGNDFARGVVSIKVKVTKEKTYFIKRISPKKAEINSRLLQASPEMYELLCDIFNNPLYARLHKKIDKVLKKNGI